MQDNIFKKSQIIINTNNLIRLTNTLIRLTNKELYKEYNKEFK